MRDAQVLHDENVGCVLPLAVELLALELPSNHEFVHRHGRQPEDRRDLVAEVKSSFAVQIKAWHARCCRTSPSCQSVGLDATTEALGGLTPELGCFCEEPAARKSIEMSIMARSFTATTRAILQQPPATQKGTTWIYCSALPPPG